MVILNIDKAHRRISLGMKQTEADPWSRVTDFFNVGDEVEAVVHKVVEKGLVVDLPHDYEGFVPISQVGQQASGRKLTDLFREGDKIPMKLIEIDPLERRIVLSIRAYTEDRNQPEEEYLRRHTHIQEVGGESLGEKLSAALKAASTHADEPAEQAAPGDGAEETAAATEDEPVAADVVAEEASADSADEPEEEKTEE